MAYFRFYLSHRLIKKVRERSNRDFKEKFSNIKVSLSYPIKNEKLGEKRPNSLAMATENGKFKSSPKTSKKSFKEILGPKQVKQALSTRSHLLVPGTVYCITVTCVSPLHASQFAIKDITESGVSYLLPVAVANPRGGGKGTNCPTLVL